MNTVSTMGRSRTIVRNRSIRIATDAIWYGTSGIQHVFVSGEELAKRGRARRQSQPTDTCRLNVGQAAPLDCYLSRCSIAILARNTIYSVLSDQRPP